MANSFSREIRGIHSDNYEPETCACSAATIPVTIDKATGAQLVTQATGGSAAPSGSTRTTTVSSSGPFSGDAFAFVVVNDAVFSALTAPGEENPSELVGPTLPAGLVIVTNVTGATLTSGVVTFYNN